jgi:hypothetical protein
LGELPEGGLIMEGKGNFWRRRSAGLTVIALLEAGLICLTLAGAAWGGVTQAWVKPYNGPGNGEDKAFAVAVDSQGNVYVTGYSTGSGSGLDYYTIKYDTNGNWKWGRRYNGPVNDYDEATAIGVDGQANVYVTGYSTGSGTIFDYATIKYDTNGNQKWAQAQRYNGPGNGTDKANAIAVDGQGNVYVTGRSQGSGSGSDYATIKYNQTP